jgi:hypothetical protein
MGMARGGVNVASNGQGLARHGRCIAAPAKGCPSSAFDRCFDAMHVVDGGLPRAEGGLGEGLIGTWQSRAAMQSLPREEVRPRRVKDRSLRVLRETFAISWSTVIDIA